MSAPAKPKSTPASPAQPPEPTLPPTAAQQVVAVPTDLAQALINYLAQQPYAQVANLINGMQQCQLFNVTENTP